MGWDPPLKLSWMAWHAQKKVKKKGDEWEWDKICIFWISLSRRVYHFRPLAPVPPSSTNSFSFSFFPSTIHHYNCTMCFPLDTFYEALLSEFISFQVCIYILIRWNIFCKHIYSFVIYWKYFYYVLFLVYTIFS